MVTAAPPGPSSCSYRRVRLSTASRRAWQMLPGSVFHPSGFGRASCPVNTSPKPEMFSTYFTLPDAVSPGLVGSGLAPTAAPCDTTCTSAKPAGTATTDVTCPGRTPRSASRNSGRSCAGSIEPSSPPSGADGSTECSRASVAKSSPAFARASTRCASLSDATMRIRSTTGPCPASCIAALARTWRPMHTAIVTSSRPHGLRTGRKIERIKRSNVRHSGTNRDSGRAIPVGLASKRREISWYALG